MKIHLMGWVMTGPPWYWKFTTGGLHGATVALPLLLGVPMGRASGRPFFLEWPASALVAGGPTPTSAARRLLRSNVGYIKCLASIGSKNQLRNNGTRATITVIIFINTEPRRRRGIPAELTIFGIHEGDRWIRDLQWRSCRLPSLIPRECILLMYDQCSRSIDCVDLNEEHRHCELARDHSASIGGGIAKRRIPKKGGCILSKRWFRSQSSSSKLVDVEVCCDESPRD